jgi:hypothetical protein
LHALQIANAKAKSFPVTRSTGSLIKRMHYVVGEVTWRNFDNEFDHSAEEKRRSSSARNWVKWSTVIAPPSRDVSDRRCLSQQEIDRGPVILRR